MSTVIIRSDVSNQDSVKEPAVVVMRRLKNGTNAHCPLQEYDLFDLSSWAWVAPNNQFFGLVVGTM